QRARKLALIPNVSLYQLKAAGKEFVPGGQIVIDDHLVSAAGQRPRAMAPDVSRSARDQNPHSAVVLFLRRSRHARPLRHLAVLPAGALPQSVFTFCLAGRLPHCPTPASIAVPSS